ncbi:hypothetical protein KSS87_002247, partial [Heliosperma pusillum]
MLCLLVAANMGNLNNHNMTDSITPTNKLSVNLRPSKFYATNNTSSKLKQHMRNGYI